MTGNKAGQEREHVRASREKARKAVACWANGSFGPQAHIPQSCIRRAIGKDVADVVRRYPMAVKREGKHNIWNMDLLEKSLRFDDPVTMLRNLGPVQSGAWSNLETEEYTTEQEASMRSALLRMMLPVCSHVDSVNESWAAGWALYRENILKRKP